MKYLIIVLLSFHSFSALPEPLQISLTAQTHFSLSVSSRFDTGVLDRSFYDQSSFSAGAFLMTAKLKLTNGSILVWHQRYPDLSDARNAESGLRQSLARVSGSRNLIRKCYDQRNEYCYFGQSIEISAESVDGFSEYEVQTWNESLLQLGYAPNPHPYHRWR